MRAVVEKLHLNRCGRDMSSRERIAVATRLSGSGVAHTLARIDKTTVWQNAARNRAVVFLDTLDGERGDELAFLMVGNRTLRLDETITRRIRRGTCPGMIELSGHETSTDPLKVSAVLHLDESVGRRLDRIVGQQFVIGYEGLHADDDVSNVVLTKHWNDDGLPRRCLVRIGPGTRGTQEERR